MKIGTLARHSGTQVETIRHCSVLDMTLAEIRNLLRFHDVPKENCSALTMVLEQHIGHVAQRIAELQALQQQQGELRKLRQNNQAARNYGILDS